MVLKKTGARISTTLDLKNICVTLLKKIFNVYVMYKQNVYMQKFFYILYKK